MPKLISIPIGILFLICIALLYLYEIRLLFFLFRNWLFKTNKPKLKFGGYRILIHIAAITGLFFLAYGYWIEPYQLEVNQFTLPTPKLKNTSLRIVQFSDTHCSDKIRLEEKIPEVINSFNPDIIVFTGDAINNSKALPLFQETLRKMNASIGKYAIRGNGDHYKWSQNQPLFENTGFHELNAESFQLEINGETFGIGGLDYIKGRKSYPSFKNLSNEHFNLYLYHSTDLIDYFSEVPIDLYLCGHSHGGQVALPLYGALFTQLRHGKKYEAGLYKVDHYHLYVNRGIGMTAGPSPKVRIFAKPEIAVFDIIPENDQNMNPD